MCEMIHQYSGTSDKGPSEIGTASLQRTLVPLYSMPTELDILIFGAVKNISDKGCARHITRKDIY